MHSAMVLCFKLCKSKLIMQKAELSERYMSGIDPLGETAPCYIATRVRFTWLCSEVVYIAANVIWVYLCVVPSNSLSSIYPLIVCLRSLLQHLYLLLPKHRSNVSSGNGVPESLR